MPETPPLCIEDERPVHRWVTDDEDNTACSACGEPDDGPWSCHLCPAALGQERPND